MDANSIIEECLAKLSEICKVEHSFTIKDGEIVGICIKIVDAYK